MSNGHTHLTVCMLVLVCAIVGWAAASACLAAEPAINPLPPQGALYQMPAEPLQTRWYTFENVKGAKGEAGKANFGRKGAPCTPIGKGKSLVLADIAESGTIRRFWATLWNRSPQALRGLKIEMYWDGAETRPCGPVRRLFLPQPRANGRVPERLFLIAGGPVIQLRRAMPFRKSARIVLVNESGEDNGIYYDIAATLATDTMRICSISIPSGGARTTPPSART